MDKVREGRSRETWWATGGEVVASMEIPEVRLWDKGVMAERLYEGDCHRVERVDEDGAWYEDVNRGVRGYRVQLSDGVREASSSRRGKGKGMWKPWRVKRASGRDRGGRGKPGVIRGGEDKVWNGRYWVTKSRWKPRLESGNWSLEEGVRYNLSKGSDSLRRGLQVLSSVRSRGDGSQVLIVTNNRTVAGQLWSRIGHPGQGMGVNVLTEKWHGGRLTNYRSFLSLTVPMLETRMRLSLEGGSRLPNALAMKRSIRQFEMKYWGMEERIESKTRPSLVIFMDGLGSRDAIYECKQAGIPSLGFVNHKASRHRLESLTYPVVLNTTLIRSQLMYLMRLTKVLQESHPDRLGKAVSRDGERGGQPGEGR
jgi:ribosomal protein S2